MKYLPHLAIKLCERLNVVVRGFWDDPECTGIITIYMRRRPGVVVSYKQLLTEWTSLKLINSFQCL